MTASILFPVRNAVPLPGSELMRRPLAVYVIRTPRGEFVQALVSRTPPNDAEVHLRTHDASEARSVAARLAITLAPTFDYVGLYCMYPRPPLRAS